MRAGSCVIRLVGRRVLSKIVGPKRRLTRRTLTRHLNISEVPVHRTLRGLIRRKFTMHLPGHRVRTMILDTRRVRSMFRIVTTVTTRGAVLITGGRRVLQEGGIRRADRARFRRSKRDGLFLRRRVRGAPDRRLFRVLSNVRGTLEPRGGTR